MEPHKNEKMLISELQNKRQLIWVLGLLCWSFCHMNICSPVLVSCNCWNTCFIIIKYLSIFFLKLLCSPNVVGQHNIIYSNDFSISIIMYSGPFALRTFFLRLYDHTSPEGLMLHLHSPFHTFHLCS